MKSNLSIPVSGLRRLGASVAATFPVLAAVLLGGVSAQAATYNWTSANSDGYTNRADWSPVGLPGIADTAIIGNATQANGAVVYTNLPPDPASTNKLSELEVGNASGTSTFNMTGGSLFVTNTSTAFTLGNASGANATFTQSGGTLVVARPSTGNLYYQDSFILGSQPSTTTYTISGGLADILCGVEIADNASASCIGTFNVNGGTVIDNGWFGVGRQNSGVTGTFNMTAGTLFILRNPSTESGTGDAGGLSLAQGTGANTAANISGGNLYCTQIRFNTSAGSTEALNISGGNLYVGWIGVFYQGAAASQPINISGGTFHTVDMVPLTTSTIGSTNTVLSDGTNWAWGANLPVTLMDNTFQVNGQTGPGYVTFAPETNRMITLNNSWSGVGGMQISGRAGSTVVLSGSNSFSGVLDVNSGAATLNAPQYITGGTVVSSGGTLNYNSAQPAALVQETTIQSGGTLGIGAAQTNAIFGVATLDAGCTVALNSGAGLVSSPLNISYITLDFNAGNTTQLFTNNVSGSGSVLATLGGTGDEWTTGNLGHTGSTIISSGTLVVDGTLNNSSGVTVTNSGMLAGNGLVGAPITVYGGAQMQPGYVEASGMVAAPGILTVSNLTFNAGSTLNIKVGASTNDMLVVKGNLTIDPNTVLNILPFGQLTPGGTYLIATYTGTLTGAFTNAIGGLTRYGLSVDYSTTGQIKLDVSNTQINASLTWVGATNNGAGWGLNGNWNVLGTVSNWFNGTSADVFNEGDAVRFDDTASNFSVALTTTLYPSSIIFDDNSNYTLTASGTGRITGPTGITKNGNGTVSLASGAGIDNDYTGPVQVNGGILALRGATSLGATNGNTTVASGATLDLAGNNPGSEPIILSGSGFGSGTNGALNNSGGTLSGNNGPRNITLNGDTTIGANPGRLDIGNGTLGAGGGSFAGNGYNLTQVGTGQTWMHELGDIGVNNININQGALGFEYTISAGLSGGTISVAPGAEFAMWQVINSAGGIDKNLSLASATFYSYSPGGTVTNTFLGAITLTGTNTLNISGTGLNLAGVVGGTGGIQVIGGGPLYLQAAETYGGPTLLNAGSIVLGAGGSIADSPLIDMGSTGNAILDASAPGSLTLSSGQTLQGSGDIIGNVIANSGTTISLGQNSASYGTIVFTNNLTLNGDTNYIKISDNNDVGIDNDLIVVNNTLTLSGVSTFVVSPLAALNTSAPYTLIEADNGITGGAGNVQIVSASPRYTMTPVIGTDNNGYPALQVNITGNAAPLEWEGYLTHNWDLVTSNWLNMSSSTHDHFYNSDNPTFDDSSSVTGVVLTNNVAVSGMNMSNVVNTYTFSGGGVITGPLNMEGNGNGTGGVTVLAMSNAPAFTAIDASAGTLVYNLQGLTNYVVAANITDNLGVGGGTIVFGGTNTALLGGNNVPAPNILGSYNPDFDGTIMVTNGILLYTNVDALGVDASVNGNPAFSPLIVTNNGTLNFNGIAAGPANGAPLGGEKWIHISGSGYNGMGALTDSKGNQEPNGAFCNLYLDGDAMVNMSSNRVDQHVISGNIQQVNGNGYKLTFTGGGALFFSAQSDGDTHFGDIDVACTNGGRLAFQGGPLALGNPTNFLMIESGAEVTFYNFSNNLDTAHLGVLKNVWLKGNASIDSGGNAGVESNNFSGPIFLTGTNLFGTRYPMHVWNAIMDSNGPGGFILGRDSVGVSSADLWLDGANSYSGATIISNETLHVGANSSLGLSTYVQVNSGATLDLSATPAYNFGTVQTNQTMAGNGTVVGPATGNLNFNAGGTLAIGLPTTNGLPDTNTFTLTINGNVVFSPGSTNYVVANKTSAGAGAVPADQLGGPASLTLGGTVVVTNYGGEPFVGGDSLALFSATAISTNSGFNIVPATPGPNLAWNISTIPVDGTLRVASTLVVNPNPTNIVFSVTGNQMTLSWPTDHTGWELEIQTNSLSVGISTNWVPDPASTTVDSITIPINLTNGTVFYRLVYPPQ